MTVLQHRIWILMAGAMVIAALPVNGGVATEAEAQRWKQYIDTVMKSSSSIKSAGIWGQGRPPKLWASTDDLKDADVSEISSALSSESGFAKFKDNGIQFAGNKYTLVSMELSPVIIGKSGTTFFGAAFSKKALIIIITSTQEGAVTVENMASDLSGKGF